MSRPMRSETEVAPEDQEETKGVLLGFVFERARGDDSLSYSETQIIIAAETNSHLRTTSGAFILGKRLAELGKCVASFAYVCTCCACVCVCVRYTHL